MEIEIDYVRRFIKVEIEDIAGMLLSGVEDWPTYQNLVGRVASLTRLRDKLAEHEADMNTAVGIDQPELPNT